jgi:hypothetical protein
MSGTPLKIFVLPQSTFLRPLLDGWVLDSLLHLAGAHKSSPVQLGAIAARLENYPFDEDIAFAVFLEVARLYTLEAC